MVARPIKKNTSQVYGRRRRLSNFGIPLQGSLTCILLLLYTAYSILGFKCHVYYDGKKNVIYSVLSIYDFMTCLPDTDGGMYNVGT